MAAAVPATQSPHRVGGWLPPDSNIMLDWVKKLVEKVDNEARTPKKIGRGGIPYTDAVNDLQSLIEGSAELRMLASAMFDEVPDKEPYKTDPNGTKQVRSYQHMLALFSHIMTGVAPEWNQSQYESGLIGFPFNAILDWPMATPSGYAFFLRDSVNERFKNILNTWKKDVLETDVSQKLVLTDAPNGWLNKDALDTITIDSNPTSGSNPKSFEDLFQCDTADPHYGFASWDAFFTRSFRNIDADRPVGGQGEEEESQWVVSSCESKPFSLQNNVKKLDSFWLKGQPYSVAEMMGPGLPDETVKKFVGGTVYQAFLSATSYHRWHSPVKGNVIYANVIYGTYFSEPTITGFTNPDGPDPAAPDRAQGYIAHIATRAVYLIDTGSDAAGVVGAIYVGMADVSTCEINDKFQGLTSQVAYEKGVPVEKGEEIGMFHHGGSTHCLLFQGDLKLQFVFEAFPETAERNIPVRSKLVYIVK
ncbi:Phophatidylserine decarboxylase-domain-containing protein [Daldinia bambusicola]|nr:Phophatidylserine decarboxylase-domain-containing protein [Daldinia bambusicola]